MHDLLQLPRIGAAIGAAGGAVIGGLIGWQVGEYRARKIKSADEAKATHGYTPQQGVVAKIDDAAAAPKQLKPGDQTVLKAQYTVLAPPEQGPVKVKETRTIYFDGQRLGRLEKNSEVTAGTYESEHLLKIPNDAAEGNYTVTTLVEPVAVVKAVGDQATACQHRPGALTAKASVQTIRDVLDKVVRFHLTEVKVRGAVVIVDILVTYEGKSESYNYRVNQGAYLMDYNTGQKYPATTFEGAVRSTVKPGSPTSFRVTFKTPPEQLRVVGITMGSGTALEGSANGGTLDDVKIRP